MKFLFLVSTIVCVFGKSAKANECDEFQTTLTDSKQEIVCLFNAFEKQNGTFTGQSLFLKRGDKNNKLTTAYKSYVATVYYHATDGSLEVDLSEKTTKGTGIRINGSLGITDKGMNFNYFTCGGGQECDDVDSTSIRIECALTPKNTLPQKFRCDAGGIKD